MNRKSSILDLAGCTPAQRKETMDLLSTVSEVVSDEVSDLLTDGAFNEDKPWLFFDTSVNQWIVSEQYPERFAICNFPQFRNRF